MDLKGGLTKSHPAVKGAVICSKAELKKDGVLGATVLIFYSSWLRDGIPIPYSFYQELLRSISQRNLDECRPWRGHLIGIMENKSRDTPHFFALFECAVSTRHEGEWFVKLVFGNTEYLVTHSSPKSCIIRHSLTWKLG